MNKRILTIGMLVTVIWIAIIVFIYLFTGLGHPKSLNEFGDFLAGVFAPVAFFWLILGYMQQGQQLEQNTKALEQQERALQLQIEEMRQGIKQQVELVQLQRQQLDAMNYGSNPNLLIDACGCEIYTGSEEEPSNLSKIMLKIHNNGIGEALNVRIEVKHKSYNLISKILIDESIQESIYLEPDLVNMSADLKSLTIDIVLVCNNKFNYEIREVYEIDVNFIVDSWEIEDVIIKNKTY
ncbi:hypothetical protein [Acinetobacter venetianus]|uniref:hypothetical protein n=2 Tax=Acinetobacter venetianus TaxID=52133 RepID=UPI003A8EB593